MDQLEKDFIELYSFQQKKYSEIENELGISRDEVRKIYEKLEPELKKIQKIRNKFTDKRKEDFENDFKRFYLWYNNQEKKCGYCGISQEELNIIFNEENLLPLNEAIKRSSGTLEIERLNSTSNSYSSENIILTCPLCNNAKSNLIDETSWRNLFVDSMREYYKQLLGCDLINSKPQFGG